MRVGCDVVDVQRFARSLERRDGFAARLFTERELADVSRGGIAEGSQAWVDRLAARFAAKEAARKALNNLALGFHETEVRSGSDGAPALWLQGRISHLSVSMSHDGGVAMAVVVGMPEADQATANHLAVHTETAHTESAHREAVATEPANPDRLQAEPTHAESAHPHGPGSDSDT